MSADTQKMTNYSSPELEYVSFNVELGFATSLEDHVIDPEQSW